MLISSISSIWQYRTGTGTGANGARRGARCAVRTQRGRGAWWASRVRHASWGASEWRGRGCVRVRALGIRAPRRRFSRLPACTHARTRVQCAPHYGHGHARARATRFSIHFAIARTASRAPRRLIPEQLKGRSVRTRQACYSERAVADPLWPIFALPYPRAAVRACVGWSGWVV